MRRPAAPSPSALAGLSLAALLAAHGLARAAAPDPFERIAEEMARRGLRLERRISETIEGIPVSAMFWSAPDGRSSQLNAYVALKGTPYMIFTQSGAGELLELDETLGKTRFPDFFGDGSRALLYRSIRTALGQRRLHVLRYEKLKFKRLGSFPEGRLTDVDGDGRFEIVTRSQPLGRFVTVHCPDFHAMAQSAFQTDLLAWEGGKLLSATPRHPAFFEASIAQREERLRGLEPERDTRPGDYLGEALSLYYDIAARGDRRRGWERLSALLEPPRFAFPRVSACLKDIRQDLRSRLDIPADWP